MILILIFLYFSRIFLVFGNSRSLIIVSNYICGVSKLCKLTQFNEICPKTTKYGHFTAFCRWNFHDPNFDFINDFDFDFINDFDFDFAPFFKNDLDFINDFDFDFASFQIDFDFVNDFGTTLLKILWNLNPWPINLNLSPQIELIVRSRPLFGITGFRTTNQNYERINYSRSNQFIPPVTACSLSYMLDLISRHLQNLANFKNIYPPHFSESWIL